MKKIVISLTAVVVGITALAQQYEGGDTIKVKNLSELTMVGAKSKSDYHQMPEIVGTNIYAGKKNTLIVLDNVQGNVVTNNMRQVLAKVAGIHVWESDPSGIQVGIAARGLSPNRSWEFNVRQNGYDISADPFGYPEAYYNPQMQSVQRIEVVRGQGALQYGPQFGGMVNYILRNGSELSKKLEFETQQTIGSFGLFNTYNAVGGKTDKLHYYAFFDHRNGNGYRESSRYFTNAGFATITYQLTKALSLSAEVMRSHIRSQQPGGLADAQVYADARQSLRNRNWFNITWTTPAITLKYSKDDHFRWITKVFATIGDRNSVGFLQNITVKDSINQATLQYANRALNADAYRNYALESRMITAYKMGNAKNNLSAGVRLYTGNTYRLSEGKGNTGDGYDMQLMGNYGKDINFGSANIAAFAENIFHIGKKLIVIPGVRFEWLKGRANGRNGFDANGNPLMLQNIARSRSFLLAGIAAEYHITERTELYANYTQAYRPIQFANLQAPPTTDIVDPNLKDARGYNVDIGYRGKYRSFLQFDVSAYYLQYNNRVGTIFQSGSNTRLITNVGNSTSKGIESYLELNIARLLQNNRFDLFLFNAYAFTDARYGSDFKDIKISNKRVENAPEHILRTGLSGSYKRCMLTFQINHVSAAYSDANNTTLATANAQSGVIPAYTVTDVTGTFKFNKHLNIKLGVNNLFDKAYFTRRAGGYPGPGAMPADGRNFFISIGAKL